jgi:hypothetical protein
MTAAVLCSWLCPIEADKDNGNRCVLATAHDMLAHINWDPKLRPQATAIVAGMLRCSLLAPHWLPGRAGKDRGEDDNLDNANLLTTMDQNCADDSASLQNNAVESPRMLWPSYQTNLKSARRSSSLILRAWLCCDAARRLAFWLEAWVNTRAAKGVAAWRSSPAVPASMSRVASKRFGSAHTFRSQLSFSVVVLR